MLTVYNSKKTDYCNNLNSDLFVKSKTKTKLKLAKAFRDFQLWGIVKIENRLDVNQQPLTTDQHNVCITYCKLIWYLISLTSLIFILCDNSLTQV